MPSIPGLLLLVALSLVIWVNLNRDYIETMQEADTKPLSDIISEAKKEAAEKMDD